MYPILLTQTAILQAVVVGGGPVGERKVRGLLDAGVVVQLISPEATDPLQAWAQAGFVHWTTRVYQDGDLDGATLVFAATNRREVNRQIVDDAARLGILCNVADDPAAGSFHVPAVYRGDGLIVTVSTQGQSPARARQVRDDIAAWLSGQENQ